jgi:hypothetical protein
MSILILILININIMDMKRHMLISLFISMLVSKERGEIIIRIKKKLLGKESDSYKGKR